MPKKRLLVVEDDVDILASLQHKLETHGYAVTTAMDGRAALKMAQSEAPNLIVLDIMLPNLSGMDVAAILREDGSSAKIPVIFLTALERRGDVLKLEGVGKSTVLPKPYEFSELLSAIHDQIGEP